MARESAEQTDNAALADWRAAGDGRGERPRKTAVDQVVWTSDGTIEGIIRYLREHPRGLLYAAEEIDTWFQRLTQYSNSSNAGYFLSMYGAGSVTQIRADRTRMSIHLARALLSICGTIQPGILLEAMSDRNVLSGLLGRFLLSMPDPRMNLFVMFPATSGEIGQWSGVCAKLYSLQGDDEAGTTILRGSHPAVDAYARWHDLLARRIFDSPSGVVKTADNKLWGNVLRLILIDHLICSVVEGSDPRSPISIQSVERGIGLGDWFSREHGRIYDYLQSRPRIDVESLEERILRWFRRRPGKTSASRRELRQTIKIDKDTNYTATEFDDALAALCDAGRGTLKTENVQGGESVTFTLEPGSSGSSGSSVESVDDPG